MRERTIARNYAEALFQSGERSGHTERYADLIEALDEAERIALLAALDPDAALEVDRRLAYDADTDRLFITGKRWRNVYHIELVELPPEE